MRERAHLDSAASAKEAQRHLLLQATPTSFHPWRGICSSPLHLSDLLPATIVVLVVVPAATAISAFAVAVIVAVVAVVEWQVQMRVVVAGRAVGRTLEIAASHAARHRTKCTKLLPEEVAAAVALVNAPADDLPPSVVVVAQTSAASESAASPNLPSSRREMLVKTVDDDGDAEEGWTC